MKHQQEIRIRSRTGASYTVAIFFLSFHFFAMGASAGAQCMFLDSALVNDTVIRLGDIAVISEETGADSSENLAGIPIGEAAPAGYSRFVNIDDVVRHVLRTVRAVRFIESPSAKRISVKTDFQEVALAAYQNEFSKYLQTEIGWKNGDYQFKIINKDTRLKCFKRPFSISFEGLTSKYPRGNFICKFNVLQGSRKMTLPVSVFMSVTAQVVVASANIRRGAPLSLANCRLDKKDITHFNYMPYTSLTDIENKSISRSIESGSIIHDKNSTAIPMITRDEPVQLTVTKGNIKVCINVRARGTGALGKNILVENEMTHKLIKATIVKPGQVVILQGDGEI